MRVVVVTGGGAGIGAGIAEAVGRSGAFVVTLDPGVSLDGSTRAEAAGPTTADRIVAAGGAARAADLSVTDAAGVEALFAELVDEHGSLDAVVNVAGISRPTGFATGSEDDWRAVLHVHLEGYLTVLRAALPIMAEAGHGRIVGVTSGSGWRPADAGAYAAAKRAVAALTWQLGADPPPGVTVNALSPIAATRMVTAALGRTPSAGRGSGSSSTGGITLTGFPEPEALGPVGAHLAGEAFAWCSGRVWFSAGSELALVAPPRLLEAVRSRDTASLPATLAAVVPDALVPAETAQATGGGATARFADAFDRSTGAGAGAGATCLVVADDTDPTDDLLAALRDRGVACATSPRTLPAESAFAGAAERLAAAADTLGRVDAVVVVAVGDAVTDASTGPRWAAILDGHAALPDRILADAAWLRAVADHSAATGGAVRVVVVEPAGDAGGRSRAQALAQLSRAARGATDDRVAAIVVGCESVAPDDRRATAELAAHLVTGDDAPALSGAELSVGEGWIGLRSHPTPAGTITFGGPDVPGWVDGALRELAGDRPD